MAKSCGVTVVGGTVPERRGEKLYNTCCVFGTKGELLAKYSKVKGTFT
jgi:omega-amidase